MSLMGLNGELWPRKMALEYTSVDFTNLVRFLKASWSLENHSEPSGLILVNSMPLFSNISSNTKHKIYVLYICITLNDGG